MARIKHFKTQRLPGSYLELPAACVYPCLTSLVATGADEAFRTLRYWLPPGKGNPRRRKPNVTIHLAARFHGVRRPGLSGYAGLGASGAGLISSAVDGRPTGSAGADSRQRQRRPHVRPQHAGRNLEHQLQRSVDSGHDSAAAGDATKLRKRAVSLPKQPHSSREITNASSVSPTRTCQSIQFSFKVT